jgi:hypothetical protein
MAHGLATENRRFNFYSFYYHSRIGATTLIFEGFRHYFHQLYYCFIKHKTQNCFRLAQSPSAEYTLWQMLSRNQRQLEN